MSIKTIFCCLSAIALSFTACKKDSQSKQGYNYALAYKNDLSAPIELRRGLIWPRGNNLKDTLIYTDTLKIAPGGIYEENSFICTKNCDVENVYATTVVLRLNIARVVINNKERMDTSCQTKAYALKAAFNCAEWLTNARNIYNSNLFKETKDGRGNVIRREYTFNEEDLKSVH